MKRVSGSKFAAKWEYLIIKKDSFAANLLKNCQAFKATN
jgi:hypothetical protein